MKERMMKKWNKSLIAITTALCLGATGLTLSASATQPSNEASPQYSKEVRPMPPGPHKYGKRHARMDPEQWKERIAQKQADLYTKLKLSPNQEGAWKAYTAATMKNMPPAKPKALEEFEKLSAPERMQKMLDRMKERQARMEEHLKAVKSFYATLTPEQQKIFDIETLPKPPRERGKDRWEKRQKD